MNETTVTTPSELEIRVERIFDAPRAHVFSVWTDPALIPEWWGEETVVEEMDVRPGGTYRFRTPYGRVASGGTAPGWGWRGFIKTTPASGRPGERTAASNVRRSASHAVTHPRIASSSRSSGARCGIASISVQPST